MALEQLDSHRQMKFVPNLTLSAKDNSKWTTNLNIKCKNIKLLEENIGEKSSRPRESILSYDTHKHDPQRKNTDKLDLLRLLKLLFCQRSQLRRFKKSNYRPGENTFRPVSESPKGNSSIPKR